LCAVEHPRRQQRNQKDHHDGQKSVLICQGIRLYLDHASEEEGCRGELLEIGKAGVFTTPIIFVSSSSVVGLP
jgi:hypothetical protein